MSQTRSVERRAHQRYPLCTGVEFRHGPSHRDFPGRCVNISTGGMQMSVPATTPVQPGHPIRIDLGTVPLTEFAGDGSPVDGTIVRVDRESFLAAGHLTVGVRFASV